MIAALIAIAVGALGWLGRWLYLRGVEVERQANEERAKSQRLEFETARAARRETNRELDRVEDLVIRQINDDLTRDLGYAPKTPEEALKEAEDSIERSKGFK